MRCFKYFRGCFLTLAIATGFLSQTFAGFMTKHPNINTIERRISALGLRWVENKGQYPQEVAFYSKTFAGSVIVTSKAEIVYRLEQGFSIKEFPILKGKADVKGKNMLPTKMNYFMTNDSKCWRNNIPVFEDLELGEPWKGIKLELHAYGNNIEKLFCIEVGADVSDIKMEVAEAKLKVTQKGELRIKTVNGKMSFTKPVAWQWIDGVKIIVPVCYKLIGPHQYGFETGVYNHSYPVFIDPLLSSTFVGGSNKEQIYGITTDKNGNVFIIGNTSSYQYPFNVPLTSKGSPGFVAKLSADLSAVLSLCLFVPATIAAIALDNEGNVLITGNVDHDSLPIAGNPIDSTYNGSYDAYVVKFSNDLTTLIASTYLGGSKAEGGRNIALDNDGNIFVIGNTSSVNFPITPAAFDPSKGLFGDDDAFVCKMKGDLSILYSSTFLGGSNTDIPAGLSIDDISGNVIISGQTASVDYPLRGRVYGNTKVLGDVNIFVSRLNNQLSSLVSSTLIGGSDLENLASLLIDKSGDIIIVGTSKSSDYPMLSGAYDQTYNGGSDIVISRFNSDLSQLKSSTFLGGTNTEQFLLTSPPSIINDLWGNLWITGNTKSSDYPYSIGAYDSTWNGGNDCFLTALSGDLSVLIYSTYFGGSADDYSSGIATDKDGDIFIGGETNSSDYPTTENAFDRSFNNVGVAYQDCFISKVGFYKSTSHVNAISVCQGDSILIKEGPTGSTFNWSNGLHADSIYVKDSGIYTCFVQKADSFRLDTFVVTVFFPTSNIIFDTLCNGYAKTLTASGSISASWTWSTLDTTRRISVRDSGLYTVIVKDTSVCPSYDSFYVASKIPVALGLVHDTLVCEGLSVTMNAWRREYNTYSWSTGAKYPAIVINSEGIFKVVASNGICTVTDSVNVLLAPRPSLSLPRDTALCFDELQSILLDAGQWKTYAWYPTGEHTRTIYATYPEAYSVMVTDSYNCVGTDTALVEEECPDGIYLPNAFTPNGDGINDIVFVRGYGITEAELRIYNRWGVEIFSSNNINKGWDGKLNNQYCSQDVYTYSLTYKLRKNNSTQTQTGTITLLR